MYSSAVGTMRTASVIDLRRVNVAGRRCARRARELDIARGTEMQARHRREGADDKSERWLEVAAEREQALEHSVRAVSLFEERDLRLERRRPRVMTEVAVVHRALERV